MKHLLLGLFALSLILLAACSGNTPVRPRTVKKRIFPKLTGHHLVLKVISTRGAYYRGEGIPTIRFELKNEGLGTVSIQEWKAYETDNIRLYYAVCKKRGTVSQITEREWIKLPARKIPEDSIVRYPIELGPKNAVIVDMPMTFFPKLKQPCTIAVRGELDLMSLDLKSLPVEINIR